MWPDSFIWWLWKSFFQFWQQWAIFFGKNEKENAPQERAPTRHHTVRHAVQAAHLRLAAGATQVGRVEARITARAWLKTSSGWGVPTDEGYVRLKVYS